MWVGGWADHYGNIVLVDKFKIGSGWDNDHTATAN